MDRQPCVYILSNHRNGTLYVGVTSALLKRVWQHKNKLVPGFSEKYHVDKLVWYEVHESMIAAIQREKAIKFWKRKWKLEAINAMNPQWRDLYYDLM
jgi:putative endonuclease